MQKGKTVVTRLKMIVGARRWVHFPAIGNRYFDQLRAERRKVYAPEYRRRDRLDGSTLINASVFINGIKM